MFIYLVSSLCVYKYVLIAGGYLTHVLIASRRKQTKRELVFFCAYTLPTQSTLCIKREKNYDFFCSSFLWPLGSLLSTSLIALIIAQF